MKASIEKLVEEHGFDSVLITRVLNRDAEGKLKVGSSSAKKIRKDGRPGNLFRYDYEEINEPVTPSLPSCAKTGSSPGRRRYEASINGIAYASCASISALILFSSW